MSKGTVALIIGLSVVSLILIVFAATVVSLGGLALAPSGSTDPLNFIEAFWASLMRTLDPGTMGGDEGWGFRLVMFMVTLGGVFIISTLIGVLTAGVDAKLEALRKGRSRVLESNHTVILGWSPQIFTIIPEIIKANENQKSGVIAILSDLDKVDMEEEIRSRVGDTGKTRIICRSGSPNDPGELEMINPHDARSLIILPPETGNADSSVIKTTLALTNHPQRRPEPYHIVTQIRSPANMDVIRMIGSKDALHAVMTGDIIARVTAQTTRQSGLSVVYTELLDFGGDEIYFKNEPGLTGKTYREALNGYEDSMVMGLQRESGRIMLNPPMDTRLEATDRIIVISEDDDTVVLSGLTAVPVQSDLLRSSSARQIPKPERCIIIGWNKAGAIIVRELDNYVAPGSIIAVVAAPSYEQEVLKNANLKNQSLHFSGCDTTDRATLEALGVVSEDHVIVLADHALDPQESDARTLITLLHLRDMADKSAACFSIVSEMLDLRNRELAEATNVDDFIVSDHLISLMMSQLSENGDLYNVFMDLFSSEGSEIYLKPVVDYVEPGRPVNFYTVLEAASQRGETALGYRIVREMHDAEKSYGVRTNPEKSAMVTFAPEDKIIVLAES
ncbi:MAG: NAD-binding protein [Verrucomicrobiae bacterium]|nr:NAD-binding protein [Verrucomicrobiae bacterium]